MQLSTNKRKFKGVELSRAGRETNEDQLMFHAPSSFLLEEKKTKTNSERVREREKDEHDETDSDGDKTLISPTQTIVNLNFRPNVKTNLFTASTPKKKGTTMEATPTSPLGKSKETRERRSVSLDSRENRKGSK